MIHHVDCTVGLQFLPDASVDSIVTDPPAGIGFMGKDWDGDKGGRDQWVAWLRGVMAECHRVLKPGGHALVWALPRTSHWTATAIEDAGFEIRDVVMHLFGCVTPDTEMLTAEGWKTHSDLRAGELVASVQPDGALRYAPLRAVSTYPFDGDLVRIKARGTDQLLTPGHRVWAQGIRAKWRRIDVDAELSSWSADQLAAGDGPLGWRLPLAAQTYEAEKSIGIDTAALYGWVLTEGHFHNDSPAVSIYQNVGTKADEIRALLGRLEIPHSEYGRTRIYRGELRDTVQFYLRVGPWSDRIRRDLEGRKPVPPMWLARLPRDEAEALFGALISGDGSWSGPDSGAFYQKSARTRAWFQALCCHLGYRTTENAAKCAVSFCTAKSSVDVHKTPYHRARWCSRVPYTGNVWCPTTIDGTWVARRAGCVFITGNTGFPKSLDVSKAIDKQRTEDREPVRVVCRAIRAAMDARALKSRHLVEHFGGCHARLIDHWAARDTDSQPALPTWEQWQKLRELLPLDAALDPEVWRLNGRKGTPGEAYQSRDVTGEYESPTPGFGEHRFETRDNLRRDKASTDAARQWSGWGTALKPAAEHWILARKPLVGTVAANVLEHGTGALNIDACRTSAEGLHEVTQGKGSHGEDGWGMARNVYTVPSGRWPANVTLDEDAAAMLDEQSGELVTNAGKVRPDHAGMGFHGGSGSSREIKASKGGASRFFYVAKPSKAERGDGNTHPTVKPIALMRWLARLITPPGGLVLDPFAGSGTTALACKAEGFDFVGFEREAEYVEIIRRRLEAMQ